MHEEGQHGGIKHEETKHGVTAEIIPETWEQSTAEAQRVVLTYSVLDLWVAASKQR